jgi:hypothetical protein
MSDFHEDSYKDEMIKMAKNLKSYIKYDDQHYNNTIKTLPIRYFVTVYDEKTGSIFFVLKNDHGNLITVHPNYNVDRQTGKDYMSVPVNPIDKYKYVDLLHLVNIGMSDYLKLREFHTNKPYQTY